MKNVYVEVSDLDEVGILKYGISKLKEDSSEKKEVGMWESELNIEEVYIYEVDDNCKYKGGE